MTLGTNEIATEHAILVEASAAGVLGAIPAALLFGVLLGAIYDIFRMISAALGLCEDTGLHGGRIHVLLLRLRQYRCRPIRCPKSDARCETLRNTGRNQRRMPARVLQCLLDILYFLICGILGAIFLYWRNYGILRWYLILGGCMGFLAYRCSIGRVVLPMFRLAMALLRAAGCLIYNLILYVPLRIGYCVLT